MRWRLVKKIRQFSALAVSVILALLAGDGWNATEAARIKDIAAVEGVRDNQLIGYGLVVGLDRTGDSVVGGQFTAQAIISMLNTMGINLKVDPIQLLTRNTASVMVTAKLPPFARPGTRLDVQVSSLANAKSLKGGTLLMTPLKAPNQEVFAVAQGPISTSGFEGGDGGNSVVKNQQSGGIVPSGAIVEKAVDLKIEEWDSFSLSLQQADFTTSLRLAEVVNTHLGEGLATPVSSGQVVVTVPDAYKGKIVQLIAAVEGLDVKVDVRAKVIVNERTGTIVMGQHVRLSSMAVSHGNLTIKIKTTLNVSQPGPASFGGETVVTPEVDTNIEEEDGRVIQVDGSVTLGDLVKALNSVGVTPRDLVAVLTAAKAAGALQADLEMI
ncbi:flagellar basal body P-ring protein FlgI [Candidatus Nitronereus thalassa]|uniref:flagellar basal body P-ring protein FlgI n=1 Tax=Candidatus Nitronereus thalassa TaxID=3020898 RepID=UPI003B9692EF